MSKFSECLSNVIGLTPSECECLEFPENWDECNKSWTGQYIDGDLDFSIPLQMPNGGDCGKGSILDLLKTARDQAIDCFVDLYAMEMKKLKKKAFDSYSDCFGEWKGNSAVSMLSNDWVGISISPDNFYKGAVLCLTGGRLSIDCTDKTFDIHIVKLEKIDPLTLLPEVIHTVTVQGGERSSFMLDIDLPLSKNGKPCRYAIVYDRQGCRPYDIKFDCGCSSTDKKPVWQQNRYFRSRGMQAGGLEQVNSTMVQSDCTYGLEIDFTLKCDGLSWLCSVDNNFWCDHEWGRIATRALVAIANMKLLSAMCAPGKLGFAALMDSEGMMKRGASLNKKIEALISYLARCTPANITDCYLCTSEGSAQLYEHIV